MRMVRSGPWDDNVLIDEMSRDVLNWLPAPADGVIHLSADKTRKDKRSRKHPLGLVNRDSKHSPYHFGLELSLWFGNGVADCQLGSLSHSDSPGGDGPPDQRSSKYPVSADA